MLQGNLTQQSTMSFLTIVEFSRSQFAAIFMAAIVQLSHEAIGMITKFTPKINNFSHLSKDCAYIESYFLYQVIYDCLEHNNDNRTRHFAFHFMQYITVTHLYYCYQEM